MSLVLSLWLRACVLVAVGLVFADATPMPNKPAGVWVCDCKPNKMSYDANGNSRRPYWNRFSCDDLSYDGEKDWGREFAMGTEGWAYSVIYCTNDAAVLMDKDTTAGKIEMMHVGVNAWLKGKLMIKNTLAENTCTIRNMVIAGHFADYMHPHTSTDRIPTCEPDCAKGQQSHLTDAQPNSKTCLLTQGHVSITPVQGDLGFTVDDWREGVTSENVCKLCVDPSDECVIKQKTYYELVDISDISKLKAAKIGAWSGFLWYSDSNRHVDTAVESLKSFLAAKTWPERVATLTPVTGDCSQGGVSTSCLHNKHALVGRLCDFKDKCFGRTDVFGPGALVQQSDQDFVIRLGSAPGVTPPQFKIQWYDTLDECTDDDSEIGPLENTKENSRFEVQERNHFKLLMGECDVCPTATPGELTSDPETSGIVTCKICRPFLDEIEDKQRFVCNQLVDYTTCNACDEHDIRDNRAVNRVPPLDQYEGGIDYDDTDTGKYDRTGQCKRCSEFQEGYRIGSHRFDVDLKCKNCSDTRYWQSSTSRCKLIDSQQFESNGAGGMKKVDLDRDQYKYDEYEARTVPHDYYLHGFETVDDEPAIKPCGSVCSSVHKYAKNCDGYEGDDAYFENKDDPADVKSLSDLTIADWTWHAPPDDVTGTDDTNGGYMSDGTNEYKYVRSGKCKWCQKCSFGEYNGDCKDNSAGGCKQCMTIADATCAPNQYLSHPHQKGCEQTRARHDYECKACPVLVKSLNEYYLAVGCGTGQLTRWHPSAKMEDGKLQSATCNFATETLDAEILSCRYEGELLERAAVPKSYQTLIPYCPPSWYFKKECQDLWDTGDMTEETAYRSSCCELCAECGGDKQKGPTWKKCTGSTGTDTQGALCGTRCENNMYQSGPNQCVYCETCKLGELP